MSKTMRNRGPRLKPSYTTRLHLKRRLQSTDWRFLLALIALAAAIAAVTILLG